MKRDGLLVHRVLSCIESGSAPLGLSYSEIMRQLEHDYGVSGDDERVGDLHASLNYQMELLEDAGFVSKYSAHYDGPDKIFYRLTWSGHDYLDESRKAGL